MKRTLGAKFSHWSYEQEVRLFVNLDVPDSKDGHYYVDFSHQLELKEVVIGIEAHQHAKQIRRTLMDNQPRVGIFQANAALTRFEVERVQLF